MRPSILPIGHQLFWSPTVSSMPVLMTNIAGERYQNEALQFCFSPMGSWSQPEGKTWSIWDAGWTEKVLPLVMANPRGLTYSVMNAWPTPDMLAEEVELGITIQADSIEELAEKTGMDVETLKETIERYNQMCAQGEDTDFLKSARWLTPIDTPPYYAACTVNSLTGVIGGIKYDRHMRVVDTKGVGIPGLYTCGTASGSFYGHAYPSNIVGCCMSHGQTFGILAVKDMLGIDFDEALPAAY